MGIEVRQLEKTFGRHPALHGVSLEVKTGELIALPGPLASGKTTLLRLIAGLEFSHPDEGTYRRPHDIGIRRVPRSDGARLDELGLREGETVFVEWLKPQNLSPECSI